uniref:Uncharacterized protein n=1 Tax=Anguilla anguilla TaxID=7936 RepID=A0A0E9VSI3_ANGAN
MLEFRKSNWDFYIYETLHWIFPVRSW